MTKSEALRGQEHGRAYHILCLTPAACRGLCQINCQRDDGCHRAGSHAEVPSEELRCNQGPCHCTGCCTHHTRADVTWSASSARPWQRRRQKRSLRPSSLIIEQMLIILPARFSIISGEHCLGAVECTAHMHIDDPHKVGMAHLQHGYTLHQASIVYQDIHRATSALIFATIACTAC